MYYVYILKSKLNSQIYFGSTNNLRKRFKEHNNGTVLSSKRYKPWSLIYYEAYLTKELARLREKKLKYHGNSIRELKKRIGVLKNGAGFTLIEVIVVFSIIAILSVIGVAGFVNYSRVQTLESAATDLSTYFTVAKSRAISQVKPTSQVPRCDDSSILNGYRVIICPTSTSDILCSAANTYIIAVRCSNQDYKMQTGTLPKNVVYSPLPTVTSFFFPVISSGVQGSGTISLSAYGYTKTVTIDSVGGIQVQ